MFTAMGNIQPIVILLKADQLISYLIQYRGTKHFTL